MADYIPTMVTEKDIRNFFSPPLDYNDVSTAEILIKIESVETFVSTVYNTSSKIACLLLTASKLIYTPSLAKKYFTLNKETLGDYSYELSTPGTSAEIQANPFVISKTWEQMAMDILNSKYTSRWNIALVND